MNRISLQVVPGVLEDGQPYAAVQITIDGSSLIDLARGTEEPSANREGHPKLAGAYAWLPRRGAVQALAAYGVSSDEKVAVLECACGVPGCWPLLAKITAREDRVVWSEFEQPHRSEEAVAGHWNYAAFGPFTFDRELYEEELRAIAQPSQARR